MDNGDLDEGPAVLHVGDPTCPWCWGMSPAVKLLAATCHPAGIDVRLIVAGRRIDGADAGTPSRRNRLRKDWAYIRSVTGQPFDLGLLERASFEHDTEPACRALVAVRGVVKAHGLPRPVELAFFSEVQRRLHVQGEDPTESAFYLGICEKLGIPRDAFRALFFSAGARSQVQADAALARRLRVKTLPTLLWQNGQDLHVLAEGYVGADELLARLHGRLASFPMPRKLDTSLRQTD
jgi:putative protein-disulfide isomerase